MKTPHLQTLSLSPRQVSALQRSIPSLHAWYTATARDLPWRRTRDPYAIWVSEVMLQQTQVSTVIPYYQRWLQAFPSVSALASADVEQVLRLWEGLGYYSRARNLHRAAGQVVRRHQGRITDDPAAFLDLAGVGPYTAAAVQSIAFDHDLAVLDGNVKRVLARLITLEQPPGAGPLARALSHLAQDLLPPGTACLHNQAVMELGALVCTPGAPGCGACPLAEPCAARRAGNPADYPRRPTRRKVPHHQVAVGIVTDRHGQVLIQRRPYQGLLGGLWEFPGGKAEPGETMVQALRRELREEQGLRVERVRALAPVDHAYTHFKVTLHAHTCQLKSMDPRAGEGQPRKWVAPSALPDFPMPRANRKILEQLAAEDPADQDLDRDLT